MVLEELAERYPQLYLMPGENMSEEYREVVMNGKMPKKRSLELFLGTPEDEIFYEETPTGMVEIVYLHDRRDFENFLRIMVCRCEAVDIPSTVGAVTLNGVVNREKIRRHKEEYTRLGGSCWTVEWQLFAADKKNYTDTLIVISEGAYSNISCHKAGYPQEEWLRISRDIRLYHECTHVICQRLYPEKKEVVWDEVVADAVGLLFAIREYDVRLAQLFLGVSSDGYVGGRLENYLTKKQRQYIDETAVCVDRLIYQIFQEWDQNRKMTIYEFLTYLEEHRQSFEKIPE